MKVINIKGKSLLFLSLLIYSIALIFSNNTYLVNQIWAPFFHIIDPEMGDYLMLGLLLILFSLLTPLYLRNPSDVIVAILLPFVYIPAVVFSISYDDHFIIKNLTLGLSYICITKFSIGSQKINVKINSKIPHEKLILYAYFVLLILFVFKYYPIMRFSSLDSIYEQRIIGKAANRFDGYLQTYFGYILATALFAYGLHYRSLLKIIFGLLGTLLLYLVTAEKTIFLMPLLMFLIYLIIKTQISFVKIYASFLILSAAYFVGIGFYYEDSLFVDLSGFWYLGRVVATPGIFFNQYFEYFSNIGYTNYAHVTGLNLFFSPTDALGSDPLFPSLGEIFARDFQGIESNSNASFIATDGIAAFGLPGVLIISLAVSAYMSVVDFLTKRWQRDFVITIFVPIGFVLTNGSFFTVLLSFGGLFWLFLFLLNYFTRGVDFETA